MADTTIDADQALRFSIFTTPESHLDWDCILLFARKQTRIPELIADLWIDALCFLREALSEQFLSQTNHYHPLIDLITGSEDWQVDRLIQYSRILRDLRADDPDYPAYLKKLKAPISARTEAMDFLLVAGMLQQSGFHIRFPKEIPNQKNPDIVCTDPNTSQSVFIEVSQMEESDKRTQLAQDYTRFHNIIQQHLHNFFYSAAQLHLAPFNYSWKLTSILKQLQKDVSDNNTWAGYQDTYFTIRLYPLTAEAEFNAWLQNQDRRKGFNAPPLDFDDTFRISGYKIRAEARHILPNRPGLIVLPINVLHFWQQHTGKATDSFEYQLQHRPNIIGVYLYSEMLHPDGFLFRFTTDDRFTRQQINGSLTRYSLFVRNKAFNCPIHPDTLKNIINSFK